MTKDVFKLLEKMSKHELLELIKQKFWNIRITEYEILSFQHTILNDKIQKKRKDANKTFKLWNTKKRDELAAKFKNSKDSTERLNIATEISKIDKPYKKHLEMEKEIENLEKKERELWDEMEKL